jgi:hypothetical protein
MQDAKRALQQGTMEDQRMKPTQDELMARIVMRAQEDAMQFEVPDYIVYLDVDHAKMIYPAEMHSQIDVEWSQGHWSEADVRKRIVEYVPKAFDWANRQKDHETLRAFGHFVAWTWLLGDREFSDELLREEWTAFGKPSFRRIAERYGVAWKDLDNGETAEMPDLGIDLSPDGSVTVDLQGGSNEPPASHDDIIDAAWQEAHEKT